MNDGTVTLAELRQWPPAVNVEDAARALGISRATAYVALREGRIGAGIAAQWVELRQQEIRAHSHQQALQQAHDSLDRGHPATYYSEAERKRQGLFNPRDPLGPPQDGEDEDDPGSLTGPGGHYAPSKRSLAYPGEDQGRANRSPVTWDGYVHARADAFDDDGWDAAVFRAMYGYDAPEDYFDE
jgi:hypothetical protein